MLNLQKVSYILPNNDKLFQDITFTVNKNEKIGLIGNNGVGKSTLLKIIAGELQASSGEINTQFKPYFIPQIFGQYNNLTIAQALKIDKKINALTNILNGDTSEENFTNLNDDWNIENKCKEVFDYWQLNYTDLNSPLGNLSGGQKMKVFLAGIDIHDSQFILLDEPTNHLDTSSRECLYNFIQSTNKTLIIVSHDRKLLNFLNRILELNPLGIRTYGGNYDFYIQQKQIEDEALHSDIENRERELKKAKLKKQETMERRQRLDNRGKAKSVKANIPKIAMNKLKNQAESSTAKLKTAHSEKINTISSELQRLHSKVFDSDKMKVDFDNTLLHTGKVLFKAEEINFSYDSRFIWKDNLNFQIASGERIALKGKNGSGKTTLIKLILGEIEPQIGQVYHAKNKSIYLDQDYSLIDSNLNIYEQAEQFNLSHLEEHEIKTRLNRFLFDREIWNKSCRSLSGGERMRLLLCCLSIYNQAPDIIILDEPVNNLDIQSIEILAKSINEYKGTLIVVSHDETFLEQIGIERVIEI